MIIFLRFVLLLLSVQLAACGQLLMPEVDKTLAELPAGNYRLDPHHTTVLFKVDHLGISSFVGRFNQADATLQFDPKAPEKSRLSASVLLGSLDVNRPDFAETLTSCDWLCVENYPEARFTTTADAEVAGNHLRFPGLLSFRGVEQNVWIEVEVRGGADNYLTGEYMMGFKATLAFNRSEFGMGSYVPLVGDQVVIEVDTEFAQGR